MGSTTAGAPKQKGMCIATRCTSVEQFIEMFHRFVDEDSFFVSTVNTRPPGLETSFSVQLADGTPVLRGICIVLQAWTSATSPFKTPGVRLGIKRLTANSMPVFERLLVTRSAPPATPPAPPTAALAQGTTVPRQATASQTTTVLPSPRFGDTGPTNIVQRAEGTSPDAKRPVVDAEHGRARTELTEEEKREQEQRTPGSDLVLPANPLMNLTDASLEGYVDCTLYEETATFFAVDDNGAPIEDLVPPPSPPVLAPRPVARLSTPVEIVADEASTEMAADPDPDRLVAPLRRPQATPPASPIVVRERAPTPSITVPSAPPMFDSSPSITVPAALRDSSPSITVPSGSLDSSPSIVVPAALRDDPPAGGAARDSSPALAAGSARDSSPALAAGSLRDSSPGLGAGSLRDSAPALAATPLVRDPLPPTRESTPSGEILTAVPSPARPRRIFMIGGASAAVVIALGVWILTRSGGNDDAAPAAKPAPPVAERAAVEPPIAEPPPAPDPAATKHEPPPEEPDEAIEEVADPEGASPTAGDGPCTLAVASTPAGSIVHLDGKVVAPSPITIATTCERHKVDIKHPRYQLATKFVKLDEGTPGSVDVTLQRPTHQVKITSQPSGATVFIDGRRAGTTPTVVSVMGFSNLKLEFKKTGYAPASQKLYSKVAHDHVAVKLTKW